MNYYVLPSTPEEIAEYERQEKERMDEFKAKLDKMLDEWLHSELRRVGIISDEDIKKDRESVKNELKDVLLKHKLYVGNSDAASILRELADEWDD